MAWRQLWRQRTALVGMGIIVVLVLTAILADILAPYEPTATGGWLQGEKAWGGPVDVQVMPDGTLLVSDDYAGAIYRISYQK